MFEEIKVVAIDGPAGSGKSTVSKLVAEKLGFTYIDTGAMYRALTLKVMKKNISFSEEEKIIEAAREMDLKLLPSVANANSICVILDGEDVSGEIRKMEITGNVKYVAKIAKVRESMVKFQRRMIKGLGGAVMEGRDIGTVVLPDAKYKFYLDASFDERVQRRFMELRARAASATREDVADDLKQRDHTDKTRAVGPLKKAENAILVDTTDLSINEVIEKIVGMINDDQ
ncbi:MAG: (d)CMP kinase [Candidatus Omnitrophica bacterium]|nr:(d)CMP kinase [Candidatus Omnitrophota bacterium]